jgi:hypothetical protein
MADFLLPAALGITGEAAIGTVIEGASVSVDIELTNAASTGAADLDWVIDALAESGTLAPGASATTVLDLQTSVPGPFDDTLVIDAAGDLVQHAPQTVVITGLVLSHAVPSFSVDEQVTSVFLPVTATVGSGVVIETVALLNMGWTSLQSRLDVDSITGGIAGLVEPPAAPPGSIAGFPGSLSFQLNTDAMSPGNLFANFTIEASDEDFPGEATYTLSVTLVLTVEDNQDPCDGDVNGDGVVDVSDLLALLDAWGTSNTTADLNTDGIVDVEDLLVLLGDWGC